MAVSLKNQYIKSSLVSEFAELNKTILKNHTISDVKKVSTVSMVI